MSNLRTVSDVCAPGYCVTLADRADAGMTRSFYVTLSSCSRPGFSGKTRIIAPPRVLSKVILTEAHSGYEKGVGQDNVGRMVRSEADRRALPAPVEYHSQEAGHYRP